MSVSIAEKNNIKYLKAVPGNVIIRNEQDVLDVIATGYHDDAQHVLLFSDNVPNSFFDLSTREAGHIIQKFSNYGVKVAMILQPQTKKSSMFTNWQTELNRGGLFNIFDDENKAEEWLVQ